MIIENADKIEYNVNTILAGAGAGSMRIGVIEEVDEQLTLTSMKHENKPHVQSIFAQGPPPPSAPVDVPGGERSRKREIFSRSAPVGGNIPTSNISDPKIAQEKRKGIRSVIQYNNYVFNIADIAAKKYD